MATKRFFIERIVQGEDEAIPYFFDSTPWGINPSAVSVKVFDVTDATQTADWDDVTTTVMPVNSPSVAGNVITLSKLRALTDGHIYRIEVKFTVDVLGDVEAYGIVAAGE